MDPGPRDFLSLLSIKAVTVIEMVVYSIVASGSKKAFQNPFGKKKNLLDGMMSRLAAEDCSKWRQRCRILCFFGDQYKEKMDPEA